MSDLTAKLFVLVQRLLPKHLLTALVYQLARIRIVSVKNFLIGRFVTLYKVNTDEVRHSIPDGFPSFNAFFTRELSADSRPVDAQRQSIVSPVDGTVSAAGDIEHGRLYQAKGIDYSLVDLLATNTADAARYTGGKFVTIYLAPYNYHRVHAPLAGHLDSIVYIPGNLFSVNRAAVMHLPGLFIRNERLVCHLHTTSGPMILIFVGAMNVGSISTQWTGEIRPRKAGIVEQITAQSSSAQHFEKGELLGWFNMGSTVIFLHPPGTTSELNKLSAGQVVRMGEVLGHSAIAH